VSADLDRLYRKRFDPQARARKRAVWAEIVAHLQRDVLRGPVLDIACGEGDFIRHVRAVERWATDLREPPEPLPSDVRFVQIDGLSLRESLPLGHFTTVFMSNYLEHLRSSDEVIEQLAIAHDVLAPGGRVIVLQPNIRLVGGRYWDFIDHRVPLTEESLVEAATTAGFRTRRLTVRFLPYTTRSALPQHPALVRAYLAFPPAWRLLGKQTLYVGERPR
jgi:SAM-dependent methyltransferase